MILYRLICVSVTYLCIEANVRLQFVIQPENYGDAALECENRGGVLLMKDEEVFDEVKEVAEIPTSQEFWIGDLLYSTWMLPIDCARKNAIDSGSRNPKNTSQLKQCYKHCIEYPFFAIKNNYCMCLDSYTFADAQDLAPCNAPCSDFGLCGTINNSGTQYVSVYETDTGVDYNNIRIESPSAIGDNYIECMTANCQLNDYLGVLGNAGLQKKGLCGTTEVTAYREPYTAGLISCAKETGTYYSGVCHNTTNQYVWIGNFRFTFSTTDGMISYLQVARGAKCTKFKTGSSYTVNCISTTENTELPFVCKIDSNPPQTTTVDGTTTRKSDGDGSTTGIAIGSGSATVAVVIVIVVIVTQRRKKNNQFVCKGSKEDCQDPRSAYAMANGEKYDHIYAETTEVYHPYLEIGGSQSITSPEYNHNLVQTEPREHYQNGNIGTSNQGFVKDTNNTTGKLAVDNVGYLEPARTPNFGRKLPQIPSEQNRL